MEPTIRFSFTQGIAVKTLELILGLDGVKRVDGLNLRDDSRFAAMLVRFDSHETADRFEKLILAHMSGAIDTTVKAEPQVPEPIERKLIPCGDHPTAAGSPPPDGWWPQCRECGFYVRGSSPRA